MRKASLITTLSILLFVLAAMCALLMHGKNSAPEIPEETQAVETTPTPTPTPSPTPEPTPEPEAEEFIISFVGDCTIGSSQYHKGSAAAFETIVGSDYAFPFAKTVEYFQNDYLSIANMEGTFTTSASSNGSTFTFKADPEYAQVFSQGGIELVVLGNNHSMDYGKQGNSDTKAALEAAGVEYAADDDYCIYQRDDGLKVGVYSKLYPNAQEVVNGVKALKDAGAEIIIAALHWGIEGSYRVTSEQSSVAHAAIDAGADIVYGSHPHVLQRVEEYGDGYILYSLGNWSFGGNTNPRDRDTAIIQVKVIRDVDGTVRLDSMEFIPCELSSADGYNNYQPHPYDVDSVEYQRAMSKLDGTFSGPDLDVDYSAFHESEEEESGEEEPGASDQPSSGEGDSESNNGDSPSSEAPADISNEAPASVSGGE